MMGWYDPSQLAKTGVDMAISTIFGQASDIQLPVLAAADLRRPP